MSDPSPFDFSQWRFPPGDIAGLIEPDQQKRYPPKAGFLDAEFDRTYPPDPPGREGNENSRVWRVYRDRVTELDDDTISGWNDTINFLLIFAGLFSAVMTAFLVETSKSLGPDYAHYMALSAFSIAAHLNGSADLRLDTLDPRRFHATTAARATNTLWYSSLTLALLVSLLSIFIKQWIVTFSSRLRRPAEADSMQQWAVRHRVFRDGLDVWHVSGIISVLSVALHVALLIFLLGLLVHLASLDWIVFGFVLALTFAAFSIYLTFTLLPLWYGACPSLTPQLVYGREFLNWLFQSVGLGRLVSRASFHQDAVLAQSDVPRAVDVIAWMISNLPPGQAVNAALDTAANLAQSHDGNLTPHDFSITVRNYTHNTLKHHATGDVNASEVARNLYWSLLLDSKHFEISPTLVHIRTHDVFYLAQAGFIKRLVNTAPRSIIASVIEAEIIQPLRQIINEQSPPGPVPMLPRTAGVLARHLMHVVSLADHKLSLEACATFGMALAGDTETIRFIHRVLVTHMGKLSTLSGDWRLDALHLWATTYTSSDVTRTWLYVHILESIGREPLLPISISPEDLSHLCLPINQLSLESRSSIRGAVAILHLALVVPGLNSEATIRGIALRTIMVLVDSDLPREEVDRHMASILPLLPSPSRHPRFPEVTNRMRIWATPLALLSRDFSDKLAWLQLWYNPYVDLHALQCMASELAYLRQGLGTGDSDGLAHVALPRDFLRGIFAIESSANFEILREFSIHLDISSSELRTRQLREGLCQIPSQDWQAFTPYRDLNEFWDYLTGPDAVCDICLALKNDVSGTAPASHDTTLDHCIIPLPQGSADVQLERRTSVGDCQVISEGMIVATGGSFRNTPGGVALAALVDPATVSGVRIWPSEELPDTLSLVPSHISSIVGGDMERDGAEDDELDRLEKQIGAAGKSGNSNT